MEDLLKEMMRCGLLIFDYDGTGPNFVLKKIPTPADKRPSIIQEFGPDTSVEYFATYYEALEKAKSFIGWEEKPEEKKIVSTHMDKHPWMIQLMYRHRGLGPQFEDLGMTKEGISYDDALVEAKERAKAHIDAYLEDVVEGWDVRIRPCTKEGF
jgi:hypothetical protein